MIVIMKNIINKQLAEDVKARCEEKKKFYARMQSDIPISWLSS